MAAPLALQVETAGIMLARVGVLNGSLTLLVREVEFVDDQGYLSRDIGSVKIASQGYVPALKKAAEGGLVPIFFHTHPRGAPRPSKHDDLVDRQLSSVFRLRSRQSHYVSCIFGGTPEATTFTGRVYRADTNDRYEQIDRARVVGRQWRVYESWKGSRQDEVDWGVYDRQVRAFGVEGQHLLGRLKVGVIGAGGTGSAIVEQLVRLGVGSIKIIDFDLVTESNLTRIHESKRQDVGRPKAKVLEAASRRIRRRPAALGIEGNVADQDTARMLTDCDVLFGCTDDHAGRAVLSRLAYWYLMPLIDTGFVITSLQNRIEGAFGRVTTVAPGEPCLICRGRIDPAMIRNERIGADERLRLSAEGYAPGLGEPDPSVVSYTTLVGSYAVSELLDRLFAISGYEDPPSEIIIRLHDRKVNGNRIEGNPDHYCSNRAIWGRGDETPFLAQTWA